MIEMLFRVGVAVVLSVGLAVLLAWGWSRSDELPPQAHLNLAALSTTSAPSR